MFLVISLTSRRGYCNNRPHSVREDKYKKKRNKAGSRAHPVYVFPRNLAVVVDTWTIDHPLTTRHSRVTEEEGVPRRNWFITCRMFFEAAECRYKKIWWPPSEGRRKLTEYRAASQFPH